MDRLLIEHVWLGVGVWALLYIAEYYLTLWNIRTHQSQASRVLRFEDSLALNPYYSQDLDALKPFSLRFFLIFLLTCSALVGTWYFAVIQRSFPNIYLFVLGGMAFYTLSLLIQHAGAHALFRFVGSDPGVEGEILVPAWLPSRLSAVELFSFSLLYAFLFAVTGTWLLLGGCAFTLYYSRQHWIWSYRDLRAAKAPSES